MGAPPPPPPVFEIRDFEDFRPTLSLSLSPSLASDRDFLSPRKTLTKSMATVRRLTPESGGLSPAPENYPGIGCCALERQLQLTKLPPSLPTQPPPPPH